MKVAAADRAVQVLVLPGWQDSGPAHWQSRWELRPPVQSKRVLGLLRVQQHDWMRPLRGDWITRLEDVVAQQRQARPQARLVLAAHSMGCHLVAAWAGLSRHADQVQAALLVAPPDQAQADFPAELHSWRRFEGAKLPFAAACVTSANDPFDRAGAGARMALAWGARHVDAGACGHINGDSGLGDWPEGWALLESLA
jgi:uncharacterized protein